MPLIHPSQLRAALKEVPKQETGKPPQLRELLDKNNLSADEILDNVSSMMRSAESDATRLKAAEMGLKLNGLLDSDAARPDFSVTIIINDSEFFGSNPILYPR